jgi:hypothetical protein
MSDHHHDKSRPVRPNDAFGLRHQPRSASASCWRNRCAARGVSASRSETRVKPTSPSSVFARSVVFGEVFHQRFPVSAVVR